MSGTRRGALPKEFGIVLGDPSAIITLLEGVLGALLQRFLGHPRGGAGRVSEVAHGFVVTLEGVGRLARFPSDSIASGLSVRADVVEDESSEAISVGRRVCHTNTSAHRRANVAERLEPKLIDDSGKIRGIVAHLVLAIR